VNRALKGVGVDFFWGSFGQSEDDDDKAVFLPISQLKRPDDSYIHKAL